MVSAIEPVKTAITTPAEPRNAATGSPESLRPASSVDGLRHRPTKNRPTHAVTTGPASTSANATAPRPMSTTVNWLSPRISPANWMPRKNTASAPTIISSRRVRTFRCASAARGWLTTRRSPRIAAPITSTGASTATAVTTSGEGTKSPGYQVPPSHGILAVRWLNGCASSTPRMLPATAPIAVSTAVMTMTWRGVAPASRSAASRRSRFAAVSRAADATSTRQGTTSTTRPTRVSR